MTVATDGISYDAQSAINLQAALEKKFQAEDEEREAARRAERDGQEPPSSLEVAAGMRSQDAGGAA